MPIASEDFSEVNADSYDLEDPGSKMKSVDLEKERVDTLDKKMSRLDTHADPFAPREGKALVWKDVNMTLVRLSVRRRPLLRCVSYVAHD